MIEAKINGLTLVSYLTSCEVDVDVPNLYLILADATERQLTMNG